MTAPALHVVSNPFDDGPRFDLYGYAGTIETRSNLTEAERDALAAFDRKSDLLPLDAIGERRILAIKNLALFGIDKGLAPAEILRGCEYAQRQTGYMLTDATIRDAIQRAIKTRMGVVEDAPTSETAGRRYTLRAFSNIRADLERVWLVDDLLPQQAVTLLYAKPNEGKSFVALDLSLAIARGEPWHNLITERGAVLYLATEGHLANRVQAYRQHHELTSTGLPFFLVQDSASLATAKGDADPLIAAAREAADISGRPVRLIVLDTLNQVMSGGNENDAADMGLLLASVARIQRVSGATVLIVHHAGKDESRGARGHSSLLAAVDTALEIRDGVMTVEKQRDGERGARYGFRLAPVNVGMDARGRVITSCIVEPVSAGAMQAFKGRQIKPGSVAAQALATVEDMAMAAPGMPIPTDAWQAEFTRRHYANAGRDTAKKAFNRARAILIRADRVSIKEGHAAVTN